jgi:hypothetical protein
MRIALPLAALLVVGCEPNPGSGRQDPTGTPDLSYLVSGTVLDSALNRPASGVRVMVGDSLVTTSDSGMFRVKQNAERGFIAINDLRFEPLKVGFAFDHPGAIPILLRGNAPYAFRCQFHGDTVSAFIVDLQGRKTMDRRIRTLLTAELNQQTVTWTGDKWLWTALDNLTWRVAIALPDSSILTVQWRLEDLDGNVRTSNCERGQFCTGCQVPQ